jgi:RNA polymerase sigma-70 factor (ECF subfamily)
MQLLEVIEIWNSNKSMIISFIRKKVNIESDIDDIIQEVFIKLWTNNQKINDKDKILKWLFSVARYTVADYYRRKKGSTISIESLNDNIPTELSLENNEESKKLIPIINSLPNKNKNILLLSEIYGLPHKEIAQQFDLTISCVKTRVVRARKLLADRMRECVCLEPTPYE